MRIYIYMYSICVNCKCLLDHGISGWFLTWWEPNLPGPTSRPKEIVGDELETPLRGQPHEAGVSMVMRAPPIAGEFICWKILLKWISARERDIYIYIYVYLERTNSALICLLCSIVVKIYLFEGSLSIQWIQHYHVLSMLSAFDLNE